MFPMDVACDPSIQSPAQNSTVPIICLCKICVSSVITVMCSLTGLFPACYRYILFDLVVSIWKWPVTKFPESQDAQNNKEFCLCDRHQCQSRKFNGFSRFSKLRDQEMEVKSPQCSHHPQVIPQSFVQPMFMPYTEGPKMHWTVNDSLYHRFLKLKLKCENILDCELAILPEAKKYKKVIAWSRDFEMDQCVSWCSPTEDLSLDVIWSKCQDFCKPQTYEVIARFDLLTSFRQGKQICPTSLNQSRGTQVNTRIKDHPVRSTQKRDRYSKCGDPKHVEGFKCPARKFQCKTCNKYGHFTSLCYKKQSSFKSRNPKMHQLQVGQE